MCIRDRLLYAVAKADGVIQPEEEKALHYFLKNHQYKDAVKWSFEFEVNKNTPLEEAYQKALGFSHSYGPSPVYLEFIEAMNVIANAADGLDNKESEMINSFSKDLTKRFERDVTAYTNYHRPDRD